MLFSTVKSTHFGDVPKCTLACQGDNHVTLYKMAMVRILSFNTTLGYLGSTRNATIISTNLSLPTLSLPTSKVYVNISFSGVAPLTCAPWDLSNHFIFTSNFQKKNLFIISVPPTEEKLSFLFKYMHTWIQYIFVHNTSRSLRALTHPKHISTWRHAWLHDAMLITYVT